MHQCLKLLILTFSFPTFLPAQTVPQSQGKPADTTSKELTPVTVTARTRLITPRIDGLLYNARNDVLIAGEKASDVLRRLPGVMVSPEGNPSIGGSSRIKVFIDGRPSDMYAPTIADALKQIPSENIASIEIITQPSAKYEAEGVDGVINITTIRPLQNGISGNINVLIANTISNLTANLNIRHNKWIFSPDIGHNSLDLNVKVNTLRHSLNTTSQSSLVQNRFTKVNRSNQYGGLNMIYLADSLTSLNFLYRLSWSHDNLNHTYDNELIVGSSSEVFTRIAESPLRRLGHSIGGGYNKKSRDKKTEFTLLMTGTQMPVKISNFVADDNGYRENNINKSFQREGTFQTDFFKDHNKSKIEAGGRFNYRKLSNNSKFDILDMQSGNFLHDHRRSNTFGLKNSIFALYSNYYFSLGNYKLRIGTRYEYTCLALSSKDTSLTTIRYNNILPNILINRTFKALTISLGYSQRIQRPYNVYLNPVINYIDSLNIEFGNPHLKPVIIHNYLATYLYQKGKVMVDGSVFLNRSADNIEYVRKLRPDGITESSWFNISSNTAYGGTLNFGWQGKHFSFRLNNTLRSVFFNTDGMLPEKKGLIILNSGYFSYKFNKGYTLTSYTTLNSRNITLQGSSTGQYWYNLILSKTFREGKIFAAIRFDNFFNHYQYINEETSTDSFYQKTRTRNIYRFFRLSFTYKIGKKEIRLPSSRTISED
jgi:ferric enterobactin receptor